MKKGFAPIVILLLVLISIVAIGAYLVGTQKSSNTLTHIPTVAIKLSPTTNPTANWTQLSLRKLNFKIPPTWWSKSGVNQAFPTEWIDLNPTNPTETGAVFQIRVDTEETTSETKAAGLIKNWKLVNISQTLITLNNTSGILLSGIADPNQEHFNSRFTKGDQVKIAVFVLNGETYQLLGETTEFSKEFDQILSTFKFLE